MKKPAPKKVVAKKAIPKTPVAKKAISKTPVAKKVTPKNKPAEKKPPRYQNIEGCALADHIVGAPPRPHPEKENFAALAGAAGTTLRALDDKLQGSVDSDPCICNTCGSLNVKYPVHSLGAVQHVRLPCVQVSVTRASVTR